MSVKSYNNNLVKLHLGSGTREIPGYINVDILDYPNIDIKADLRNLPFQNISVDFIYSCAAIEHFGRKEWKEVLKHWFYKLKPGGTLRLSTADFNAVCEQYLENRSIDELLGLIVGGQKDEYDWHGMVFDFDYLKSGLEEIGFINVRRYNWKETELFEFGIDDYSQAYLPHMDKKNGRLMMLNVIADKSKINLSKL